MSNAETDKISQKRRQVENIIDFISQRFIIALLVTVQPIYGC